MTLAPKAITSLQNDRVKAIRALEMRKERKETGLFAAEGTSATRSQAAESRPSRWVGSSSPARLDLSERVTDLPSCSDSLIAW